MSFNLQYLLPKKIYRQVFFSFLLALILIISIVALITNLSNQSGNAEKFQLQAITVAHNIRLYDEILTMSARMSAFTGNTDWDERYQYHVIRLDEQLAKAVSLYPEASEIINSISEANLRLVSDEEKAMSLANEGRLSEAQVLLLSPAYEKNKAIYQTGLNALITQLEEEQQKQQKESHELFFITIFAFLILLTALGFILWKMMNVLILRLEIENTLALVAKKLLIPVPETIDEDISWTLNLIAEKAEADYAFFVLKRTGKHTAVISEWGLPDSHEHDNSQYNQIAEAVARLEPNENSSDIFSPSATLLNMGLSQIIGQSQSDGNRHCYQLCLLNPRYKEFNWSQKESNVLSQIIDVITRALDSIDKIRQLRLLAERDCLTNLLNRRKYMEILKQEWQRYTRFHTSCAIMMLDIDHFKNVNDTFGHTAGDLVLAEVTSVMQQTVRHIDTVGRVGGEEFSILLPGVDREEGNIIAERIREKIQATRIETGENTIQVTISIGITMFDCHDENGTVALSRADKALYKAKENGRNQVICDYRQ
ncbi:hypothetical protein DI392_15935 [Vibrio albus]|uniref:diguanylate cyclase n=1 Tax=Vibrio albus TaxID=2200953 RepID=A0A2U3B5V4_9VIBR|nr:GGDEF domain-containing protein [Vibrio albus]PWI32170.1 hypothetical protein DI392_15935 [Vibrio albus]